MRKIWQNTRKLFRHKCSKTYSVLKLVGQIRIGKQMQRLFLIISSSMEQVWMRSMRKRELKSFQSSETIILMLIQEVLKCYKRKKKKSWMTFLINLMENNKEKLILRISILKISVLIYFDSLNRFLKKFSNENFPFLKINLSSTRCDFMKGSTPMKNNFSSLNIMITTEKRKTTLLNGHSVLLFLRSQRELLEKRRL